MDKHEFIEENLDNSIVNKLIDKYEATPTTYLASSQMLISSSTEKLSRETMDEIFKSKSKYYPQLKIIKTNLKYEVVYISPEVARDILKFSRRGAINPELSNRTISNASVKRYAKAMDERKWCLTGEPIIFGEDGELQNGHTRLSAAAESKTGFITVIGYGITDDLSFAHIDVGKVRTRSNVLQMAGVTVDASVLAQVAMLAKAYENTKNPYAFRGTQGTAFQPAEILEYVEQHEELALSVDLISTLAKKHKQEIQTSHATYAFAHYLIKQKLSEIETNHLPITPELYLTKIISSIGIQSENDIEYQVRNYLQTLVGEGTSYTQLCRLSAIFKGWNMYLSIPVIGSKISVRRVARFTKDEDGNRLPAKGAGNINEAFTVPCIKKGKTPRKIEQQANMQRV